MHRRCSYCGRPLAWDARADARFCSTRCRVANHRATPIPLELRSVDRWVRHRNKVPLTVVGRPASSTNPATWAPYALASTSHLGDGPGFVLAGDGIVCLDLDHCVGDGHPSPPAKALLDRCPETYIELSPSGTGLHIWGHATLDASFCLRGYLSVEVYADKRYITITSKPYRRGPLADLTALIRSL